MKHRYTNLEIAKAAYCSEATVKKAIERGLSEDLEKLLGWVLMQRMKIGGLSGIDGLSGSGTVKMGGDLGYIPDDEHGDFSEVDWGIG